MFKPGEIITRIATQEDSEKRLDIFLSEQFPDYSRSLFKNLIEEGAVTISNKVATKAGVKLKNTD